MNSPRKDWGLWAVYAFAVVMVFSGIDSHRAYRLNGFVLGKNTIYHGMEAQVVAVAELAFGILIFTIALRSHIKKRKDGGP